MGIRRDLVWRMELLVSLLLVMSWQDVARAAVATAPDESRICVGLLWCRETTDDGVTTQGLLYLYGAEERGSFSRLTIRPFYSREEDPARDYLRRSILWPLGVSERVGDSQYLHVIPFYWHKERPGWQLTLIPPLYFDHAAGPRSFTYLVPLYGHSKGLGHELRFVFPLFGSASDERTGTRRLAVFGLPPIPGAPSIPSLSLYEHRSSSGMVADRLFPIYRYVSDVEKGRAELTALLLYHHRTTADTLVDRLLPFYTYEQDRQKRELDFSMMGYRSWSLFSLSAHPAMTQHKLFPLYSFEHDVTDQATTFGLIGLNEASLYFHESAPGSVLDRLFPLYSYRRPSAEELRMSVLGIGPAALYYRETLGDRNKARLFPVYDYARHGESRAFSILGVGAIALYRQENSPDLVRHRLFPLYRYRHDRRQDEIELDTLFVYRHLASPRKVADHLLPLWDYARTTEDDEWQLGLLGVAPLTLYHHHGGPSRTADRLFPLYGYRGEPEGTRLAVLGFPPRETGPTWALYEHVSRPTLAADRLFPVYRYMRDWERNRWELAVLLLYQHRGTETGVQDRLLPLHHFAYDEAEETWDLHLLGVPPVTVYRHRTSPEETASHLLPLYGYRRLADARRWSLLGLPPAGSSFAWSLFEYSRTHPTVAHRFSPLYAYRYDEEVQETRANVLGLYWHQATPSRSRHSVMPLVSLARDDSTHEWSLAALGLDPVAPLSLFRLTRGEELSTDHLFPLYDFRRTSVESALSLGGVGKVALYHHDVAPQWTRDRLFPLWSYEHQTERGTSRLGLLGIPPLSLYAHDEGAGRTSDRLFPLYTYASNEATDEARFSFLWPLMAYERRGGETSEVNFLWWLFRYERPDRETRGLWFLGVPPAAVVVSKKTSERSVFEFNPIVPMYRYESVKGRGVSWSLLGGLLGVETTEDGRHDFRLLWVL